MLRRNYKKAIIRYPAYGVLVIVFFALQSSRLPGWTFWGATADVMPFITAAAAIYENPYCAGIVGFGAGLIASLHSTVTEGVEALFLAIFGIVFAYFAKVWFSDNALLPFFGGIAALFLFDLLVCIFYYGLVYEMSFGAGVKMIFARLVLSSPGGALACFLMKKLSAEESR